MRSNKFVLLMAMLVLAIFAVGSVSAADNVTADIDVPAEDIAIDDVTVDDVDESNDASSDANKIVNTRSDSYISAGSSSSVIDAAITTVNGNGGGNVYFTQGDYYNISITMKSNVNLIGNGARLVGDGVNTVIKVDNCNNFTITGFVIDGNYISSAHNITVIRGSGVTNGNINNNILYNAYSGMNIFRSYDNMTIENNVVRDMIYDGISLAHPNSNNNINTNGHSSISGNNVTNCTFGIFIGGNFNGDISNNTITVCAHGIQSLGKKDGQISNIIATITGNNISAQTGIEFINMTVVSLSITENNIITPIYNETYAIYNGENFSKASGGELYITDNVLHGCINQSLVDLCDYFDNIDNGYRINDTGN